MSEILIKESEVKASFDLYDTDRNGVITFDEMGAILSKCNPLLDAHTLNLLMSKYDHNKDGLISYKEFIGFLTGNPLLGLDLPPVVLIPVIPVQEVQVTEVVTTAPVNQSIITQVSPAPIASVSVVAPGTPVAVTTVVKETVTTTTTTVIEDATPTLATEPYPVTLYDESTAPKTLVQGENPLLPDVPILSSDPMGNSVQVNVIPHQQ